MTKQESNEKGDIECIQVHDKDQVENGNIDPHEPETLCQAVAKSVPLKILRAAGVLASILSIVCLLVVAVVTASDKGVMALNIPATIFLAVTPAWQIVRGLNLKDLPHKDPTGILPIFAWTPDTDHGWKSDGGLYLFVAFVNHALYGSRMNGRSDGAYSLVLVSLVLTGAVAASYQLLGQGVEMRIKTANMPFGACKATLIYFVPFLPPAISVFVVFELLFMSKPAMLLSHG